jgi:1,4-dihydroxy-2-naphthoate octaprenyltransferase
MARFKDYFIATRPWSFSMTAISVCVGTALAAADGPVAWGWLAAVLVGAVCFHAAANVINDYFDTRYGVDQPDSPTAHYRPHPLLGKMMTPRQLLLEAVVLYAVTIGVGLAVAFARSMDVLWIGIVGFLASLLYTAGPVKYKYRGLGELSVFLMWGPLMVGGAYAAQRGALSLRPLVISIPFGVLVALVLFANNMRDISYDSRQGVRTLSILLGRRRSLATYLGLFLAAYIAIIAMVATGYLTPWALLVFLSLPKAIGLFRTFARAVPDAADALTAQLDTIFGICLLAGLVLARLIPS